MEKIGKNCENTQISAYFGKKYPDTWQTKAKNPDLVKKPSAGNTAHSL